MYLWAEFLFWGNMVPHIGVSYDNMDKIKEKTFFYRNFDFSDTYAWQKLYMSEQDELSPLYWYTKSVEAGYLPAICWLGWCAKNGIGMDPDEKQMKVWFEKAKEYPKTVSFVPNGLGLFAPNASQLSELAHWADIEEDEVTDRLSYHDPGTTGEDYPNPTWRDLHAAAIAVYELGCMFGSIDCVFREDLQYDYDVYEGKERFVCYLLSA